MWAISKNRIFGWASEWALKNYERNINEFSCRGKYLDTKNTKKTSSLYCHLTFHRTKQEKNDQHRVVIVDGWKMHFTKKGNDKFHYWENMHLHGDMRVCECVSSGKMNTKLIHSVAASVSLHRSYSVFKVSSNRSTRTQTTNKTPLATIVFMFSSECILKIHKCAFPVHRSLSLFLALSCHSLSMFQL